MKSTSVRFATKTPQGGLEVGASLIEVGGGAVGAFARFAAGIEPASPLPSGRRVEIADTMGDRAGEHIAVIDAPALMRDVGDRGGG